jgi:hypothetical protein
LLFIKLREGFVPDMAVTQTFPLPQEESHADPPANDAVLEREKLSFPALILMQRQAYQLLEVWYQRFYSPLTWFCIAFALICLYRRPLFTWFPHVTLALSMVFFPTVVALSHWRYIISGIVPILMFLPFAVQSLLGFLQYLRKPSAYAREEPMV